ncbi:unnamed protein product [Effrenium voratum]|uniref:Uncharacterized protein n=1 Tax=Effrenium voratum TaxID=2562239 RepID=A0AA36JRD0_9DINO|nr:unnamed protein product [Effrenium voratum]
MLLSEVEERAQRAADEVKRIQGEAEEGAEKIAQDGEAEVEGLERERLERQKAHEAMLQQLQEEVLRVREVANERVEEIEAQMQAEEEAVEREILQKAEERAESLRLIKEDAENMSSAADEQYQLCLDQEKQAQARARQALAEMERKRRQTVEEAEQSCQLLTASSRRRLEGAQADLAQRIDQLLRNAMAARLRLQDTRETVDAQWAEELMKLRQEARDHRLEAAHGLEQARAARAELEATSRDRDKLSGG